MKKILMAVGGVVAVAIVGLLGVASMQPDTYHVERSVQVAATPTDVFPYLNDYGLWDSWNPFKDKDPNIKTTYSANKAGVGAWTAWEGNSDVGKGKMTLKESVPGKHTTHDLEFIEPMQDHGTVTFSTAASGDGTKVTWAMDGDMNLMSKTMCLFGSMDGMIGPNFEKGLNTLKPKVEADAKTRVEAERVAAEEAAAAAAAATAAAETPDAAGTAPIPGAPEGTMHNAIGQ